MLWRQIFELSRSIICKGLFTVADCQIVWSDCYCLQNASNQRKQSQIQNLTMNEPSWGSLGKVSR